MEELRRGRRGVTLIEVLVAAVIVSSVFVVVWYLYSHGMSNLQATERVLESTRGAHILFELLHRDLKRAREVAIPRDLLGAADPKMEPGDAALYVDLKEYLFRKKTRTVTIDGDAFRLGQFEEIAFTLSGPGLVTVKIVPIPSSGVAGEPERLASAGRYVLESAVWVEHLAASHEEPTLVANEAASHEFCLNGWPLDY
jgi:prepilin-type N-terminal cleavage/methylation domain-containing protein